MTSSAFLAWAFALAVGHGSSSDWTIVFLIAMVLDVALVLATAMWGSNEPVRHKRRR